jgi:hypothetical protein
MLPSGYKEMQRLQQHSRKVAMRILQNDNVGRIIILDLDTHKYDVVGPMW